MTGIPRRLAGAAVTWVVVLGVVGVAVHPERCSPVAAADVRRASELAVGWFDANLEPDGSFVYRYDRERSVREPGYNETRHAGVLLSLYQAEAAGISGAAQIADLGLAYVDDRIGESPWGTVFGQGSILSTGAIALLVSALDERRAALAQDDRNDLLLSLGDTLIGTITENGAVNAKIDRETGPVDGTRDRFFTGEVLWALSRLELGFPGRGYGAAADGSNDEA